MLHVHGAEPTSTDDYYYTLITGSTGNWHYLEKSFLTDVEDE